MFDAAESTSWWARTAPEITELARRAGSVLVLPVGSIEQHGHHLPVATDTILVDTLASEAAEAVADDHPILVAPPVWSGYSPHHLPFGGTLTVAFETLRAILEQVADAALENGFDAVVLLNGHGGNTALVSGATSTIGVAHPEAEVLGLTYFGLADSVVDEVRDSDPGGMAHGGEFETSLMLHYRPELVREELVEGEPLEEPYELGLVDMFEAGPLSVYRPFDAYSSSGAVGSPELATAEKGSELASTIVDELASLLREVSQRHD